jgi:protein Mpv17
MSHLRDATIQSGLLDATSSVLAQLIRAYKNQALPAPQSLLNPLGLNWAPIIQFFIYRVISTAPNVKWQEYLERKFPAYSQKPRGEKLKIEGRSAEKVRHRGETPVHK